MVEKNQKAVAFCLPNQDNETVCLKDLAGKWTVLYFYPKDMTSGCTKEAVGFSELLEEFDKLGSVIIGISPDSPKRHQKFIEKNNLKITLLSDQTKETMKVYGAWGKKKVCGKECEGVIRSTFIIDPNLDIVEIYRNVRVKGHVETVKNRLAELVS